MSAKENKFNTVLCVPAYKFKRGNATGCFRHRVFLVMHDAVKYSSGH